MFQFGNKRVLAEVRSGRLIVRVGGGFLLIEDYLRHFAEEQARGGPGFLSPLLKPNRISLEGFGRRLSCGSNQSPRVSPPVSPVASKSRASLMVSPRAHKGFK